MVLQAAKIEQDYVKNLKPLFGNVQRIGGVGFCYGALRCAALACSIRQALL